MLTNTSELILLFLEVMEGFAAPLLALIGCPSTLDGLATHEADEKAFPEALAALEVYPCVCIMSEPR